MLILNIATTFVKSELTIQNASLDLKTTRPQLEINSEPAKLELSQSQGTLEIDQTACRYAYGVKNLEAFTRDFAQEGMRAALEAIGSIAEKGDRLAHIAPGTNPIADMARESTISQVGEVTWVSIPPPQIRYTPHEVEANFIDGKLDISSQMGTLQEDYQPGKVEINIAKYPSIKMWTSENKIDMMV